MVGADARTAVKWMSDLHQVMLRSHAHVGATVPIRLQIGRIVKNLLTLSVCVCVFVRLGHPLDRASVIVLVMRFN